MTRDSSGSMVANGKFYLWLDIVEARYIEVAYSRITKVTFGDSLEEC